MPTLYTTTKAIIFDLDETLVDRKTSLTSYAQRLYAEYQPELEEKDFLDTFHRLDGNGRVPRSQFFTALCAETLPMLGHVDLDTHFYEHAWSAPLLFPSALKTLENFRKADWRIGIVTNGGIRSQSAKLRNTGVEELIDAQVISESFGVKKPDQRIYREICSLLDIDPENSWFVGDDPISDVWGPKQIGFQTAWIERHLPWPSTHPLCYDYRINDVGEMNTLLQ